MSNVFALTQRAFRFYEDGTESGSVAIAAENTNITRQDGADQNLLLRIGLQESGSGSISGATTDDFQLQYSKNGGAYTNVTGASSNVKGFASTNLTDADTTTNRLSAGSGSFVAGEISEDGLVDDRQITANNYTEMLYAITVVDADTAGGDTLDFRVLLNGGTITYSVTPRITISGVFTATGASTLNPVTVSGTGKLRFVGTAAITLAAIAMAGSGTHTQAAEGVRIAEDPMDRRITEDGFRRITEGAIAAIDGTSAIALPSVTVSGAGKLRFVGTGAITLNPITTSGAGKLRFAATSTVVLPSVTVAGTGVHTPDITGTVAIALNPITVSGAGKLRFVGTGAITLNAITTSGAGKLRFAATSAIALNPITVAGSGKQSFKGTGAITLNPITVAGSGTHTSTAVSGTGSIVLPSVTVSGAGKLRFVGSGAITLPAVTTSGAGKLRFAGTSAIALNPVTTSGSGKQSFKGTGAITLNPITAAGAGKQSFTGTSAITLPAVTVAGSGDFIPVTFTGTGAIVLAAITVSGAGIGPVGDDGFSLDSGLLVNPGKLMNKGV